MKDFAGRRPTLVRANSLNFYGTAASFYLYSIKNSFLGNGCIDNILTTNSYLFQNAFYTMGNHSDVEILGIRD